MIAVSLLDALLKQLEGSLVSAADLLPVRRPDEQRIERQPVVGERGREACQALGSRRLLARPSDVADCAVPPRDEVLREKTHPEVVVMQHAAGVDGATAVVDDHERLVPQGWEGVEIVDVAPGGSENDSVNVFSQERCQGLYLVLEALAGEKADQGAVARLAEIAVDRHGDLAEKAVDQVRDDEATV